MSAAGTSRTRRAALVSPGAVLAPRDTGANATFLCERIGLLAKILGDRGGVNDMVKVLDFGLVKDTGRPPGDPNKTEVNALIGTPAYMSPEAIASPERVDARSDLYAVGAIGYYLLTGTEVFPGSSIVSVCVAHIQDRPVPPSERLSRPLPEDLEALILRCLEKDPAARPASALELRKALLACNVPAWALERGAA